MSLGTITTTAVLLAVLFTLVAVASARWESRVWGVGGRVSAEHGAAASDWLHVLRIVWPAATAEALVLTLLAALWFGSVGSGGWLLLFLLLGTLVAGGDRWLRHRPLTSRAGNEVRLFVAGVLKYLLAGLVCAWRLS